MIRRSFLALLLLAVPANAQEPIYKTNILTVSLSSSEDVYYYMSAGVVQKFASAMGGIGQPFKYEGSRRFVLRDSEAAFAPPADGQQPPPPTAVVDLPENCSRVLLISVPLGPKKVRLIAYDVSDRTMKDGDYRFFNFSKSNLSMILGEERFAVPSGADRIATSGSWRTEIQDLSFSVGIVSPDNRTVVPANSYVWGHRPVRRNLILIFDGARGDKSVQIRKFYDVVIPDAPPAGAGGAPQ